MTKRTLFIIIGLLVLLDLAAIIIYLAGTKNGDGRSPLDLTFDKSNEVTLADTIPQKVATDEFDTIQTSVNFLSTDKVQDGGELKRMSSTVKVKFIWPKEINKSKQFMELENALMMKLTGQTYSSVKKMVNELSTNPKFVKPSTHFTRVNHDFSESKGVSHTTQRYMVFPYFSTHYLLEMVVVVDQFNGGKSTRTMNVVHYDRMHGNIITADKIFDPSETDDILALLNQSIEAMKIDRNNDKLHETTMIPKDFLLGTKSVIFYVPDGTIAPTGTGLYEVRVSNDKLRPHFTDFYNDILSNDSHFVSYEFLTW